MGNAKTITARVVSGGKNAIYDGPKQEAEGCRTIPGMKPTVLRGQEAKSFMMDTIPDRCFNKEEAIVLIGNEDDDVQWMLQHLTKGAKSKVRNLTIYNPRKESEIENSEKLLKEYLNNCKGCLLTLGRHFNGMESTTIVFTYNNPYASNFRANYLRASVELILLDRNELGLTQIPSKVSNIYLFWYLLMIKPSINFFLIFCESKILCF